MEFDCRITEKILRLPKVKEIAGFSTSTIYAKVASGDFPKPINLGNRSVGWLQSEIAAWIESRVRESRPERSLSAYLPQNATASQEVT